MEKTKNNTTKNNTAKNNTAKNNTAKNNTTKNNTAKNNSKKLISQNEFLKICSESEKESSELLELFEISEFSEEKTETKVKNDKKQNVNFSTVYEFLKQNQKEFIKLTEKIGNETLMFHYAMQNSVKLSEVFLNEKFCSKEQIEKNAKVIKSLSSEDLTKRNSVKEVTLNKFESNFNLIFSISKNHIESIMNEEDKQKFNVCAIGNNLFIRNKETKKAKLIYSVKHCHFKHQKNFHYCNVSNIVEVTKSYFKKWKLELS